MGQVIWLYTCQESIVSPLVLIGNPAEATNNAAEPKITSDSSPPGGTRGDEWFGIFCTMGILLLSRRGWPALAPAEPQNAVTCTCTCISLDARCKTTLYLFACSRLQHDA